MEIFKLHNHTLLYLTIVLHTKVHLIFKRYFMFIAKDLKYISHVDYGDDTTLFGC